MADGIPRKKTGKGDYIMKKGRVGSSFEEYLEEQGTLEETTAVAVKRVLAWRLEQAMEEKQLSKRQMAIAMNTSRSQLDRILDPNNDRIRLDTLTAAARAVGLRLRIDLVERLEPA
jgi:antitoxin HicB